MEVFTADKVHQRNMGGSRKETAVDPEMSAKLKMGTAN